MRCTVLGSTPKRVAIFCALYPVIAHLERAGEFRREDGLKSGWANSK
jgi:hypothetical protein